MIWTPALEGWGQVLCLWGMLQANVLTFVSAMWVQDMAASRYGGDGGRNRSHGEAFLCRVHFSHSFHWILGHIGWANQWHYKPGSMKILSCIARSPVITLPLSGSLCCWSKWFESSKFWCKKHLPPQILPGLGLPHVLVALLLLRPAGFGHVISYFDDVWLLDNITMNSKCLT